MRTRILCLVVTAWMSGVALAAAQAPAGQPAAAPVPVERTPWGHPDLQGTWDYRTITPLERPRDFGDREFYTPEEIETLEGRAGRRMDGPPEEIRPGLTHAQYWTDPGRRLAEGYRTSLIVDPPDGRIPAPTQAGQGRRGPGGQPRNAANESWLDRGNQERCITYGLPTASLPTLYNNNIQIVQSPGAVVIVHEMIHEARVIPLDGRPRLTDNINQWIGSSRGYWDGDTLVVETTNFSGQNNYRGSTTGLHLTERYTRTGPDKLEMRLTVEDPATWDRPWTAVVPMRPTEGNLEEYACHEANYSMINLLEVARDAEKAAAAGEAPATGAPSR